MTYSALDIAKYVINHEHLQDREISNLRLQKLLYFIQAKVLIKTGNPCFDDEMQAWEFGPVVPVVYHEYKIFGGMDITDEFLIPHITREISSCIIEMLDDCANYPTFQLVNITHAQSPWKNARAKGDKSIITIESIKDYFKKKPA
ncbi:Panacea domain-containing protein [Treponema pectinovorum]|nr:type II toxin-antitoxin system antitoxin SocA domain-containing protein [Treponema pectinovorum]